MDNESWGTIILSLFVGIVIFVIILLTFVMVNEVPIDETKALYFYSESCSVCVQIKPIINTVEKEYEIEWVDVNLHRDLISKYNIISTPTFVKQNGEKLVGFHNNSLSEYEETLRNFLE